MLDIDTIADTFDAFSNCVEVSTYHIQRELRSATKSDLFYLNDRHADADAWIAASDDERVALRQAAEVKHRNVMRELARVRSVSRAEYLARKAEDLRGWRHRNPDAYKARQKAWRDANREYIKKHMKAFRAKVKADPVRYAAEREANTLRMREKRARWKAERDALNPPKPKLTAEEKHAAKLAWNRKYQKTHPPKKRSEAEMQRRRDYYRAKYHENKTRTS